MPLLVSDPWAFGWTQLLTIVGFAITIGIALGGFRTFGRWKREKLEEKRIEVAIEATALAYEALQVFEDIRARGVYEHEYADMAEELKGQLSPTQSEQQRSPYVVLKRIRAHHEFFERVWKLEPRYVAIFGREEEQTFRLLHGARRKLEISAEALFEEYRVEADPSDLETRERRRRLRTNMFASQERPFDAEDDVGTDLGAFRERIDTRCRPLIDLEYARIDRLLGGRLRKRKRP